MKLMIKMVFALLVLTLVTACVSENLTSVNVTERLLSFLQGYYNHVVFMDGQVIGFMNDLDYPVGEQVYFAYEGDEQATLFKPENDPKCIRYSEFQVVGSLPDGRLGLLKECNDDSAATIYLSKNRSIFAYDWKTGELEQLVAGKLTQGAHPKSYTWNPDMTLGIQETGPGYPGTIYWIEPTGMSPMDIEITDRGLTWNLKDYLEGKERTGAARHPAWSPDGKTIAFFVTTYGILEEPASKFNVNYDLFFMDPTTLKPRPELMDVADAGKIVWSPNNEYLLFRDALGVSRRAAL
jgi:hypothetical protein